MFFVFEIQTTETGSVNVFVYNKREDAEEKYHDILRYAPKSPTIKHGAMLCTDDLFVIKSEVYNHVDQD